MAGNQTDNLLLLDLTTGLARTNETGGTPDTIQLSTDFQLISGANALIDGNLVVNGTTTTVHSEQVNIRDNHLYLNADYTTTVAQTGGLAINVLPTATSDTVAAAGFTAGVAAVSNPTVITTGSATFSAGDVVQIAGANDQANDNIYEVLSHVGTTLTIRGIGLTATTVPWVANQFVTDATAGGDIRVVNVNVLQGTSTGTWETATVNTTTGISYNTFTTQGTVDLQEAYDQGSTITTNATDGDVTIAGTESLVVTATGGVDINTQFDFDGTVFDVQMTGTNGFSIDGTAASNVTVTNGNLDLTTITTGDVNISSVAQLDLDAGTTIVANTANATDASGNDITITAGSSTGGTNAGASIILTPGDGDTTGAAGSVDLTGPNDEDEAILTLETTGTNGDKIEMYVGDSAPSGVITALAGSLFFRDTGSGAELYLNTSTGSGTTWTQLSTGAGNSLQAAYAVGNSITTNATDGNIIFQGTEDFVVGGSVTVDFDTTDAISLDADVASNFTVNGAGLTLSTTTSGDVDISSAAQLDLDATTTIVANTANATDASGNDITITAGSSTGGTNAGASIILTPGDGDTTGAAGSVDLTGPNDEDEAILSLETTGTNGDKIEMFVGDSDPSGSVTGLAGSLFFRDTAGSAELYLNTSNGSGTTWTQIATGGTVTLQNAYVGGNTITTNATEGDITFQGTEDFIVGGSVTVDFDTTDAISLDADVASNFTVNGAGLTLSTTTSGDVDISSAAELDLDATTTMVLNTANAADASGNDITITAATSTGGTAGGASIILTPGDGNTTGVAGSVDVTGPNDEDEAILTLATTGTNGDKIEMYVGDSDPSGSVTGLAGSLFFRDTGSGAELYLNTSNGSGTTWTQIATGGTVTLQGAYEGGNTITTNATEGDITFQGTEDFIVGGSVTVDFDTTDAISLDADVASNFTVNGANLTLSTTTSGTVDITSADDIQVTFETANASAMVVDDGTNTYITFDSTTGAQSVEVSQFLDIVGKGAGITLTAGENLTAGDVVTIEDTTGDCVKADSNTGTTIDGLCIGVVATSATDTNPVQVFTVPGGLIPVAFSSAPAASNNGDPVYVSQTAGVATLTAPTGSGNVVYIIGILQGADGADTTPNVVFQPQFIAVRP